MQIKREGDTVHIRFEGPATTELDRNELDFPDDGSVREFNLEFRGVKLISSMVLASMMFLMDRHRGKAKIRLMNLEPEMRNLLTRTGLGSWLEMAESSDK